MKDSIKIIAHNKKARFEYFIEDKFEAGVVLAGSEVKSIALGNITLGDSFCLIRNGEAWLKNCQIAPYVKGSVFNEDPRRDRKLLLNRSEINKLIGKLKVSGYSLVPLSVYFKRGKVKIEIGLVVGKKLHDKRAVIKERDILRSEMREMK